METQKSLTLYQREACPYCQIVRKKLTMLNLPALMVPVERKGEDRKILAEISGQNAVPVLVDGGQVICGSQEILDHLDERHGSGKPEPLTANKYGLKVKVKGSFEEVVEKTTQALKKEGFGIQSEIDISATLKKKIGVDVPQQTILGACNPHFAHQALEAEPDLGLLLPCNVVVRATGNGEFWVTAVNPVKLLAIVGRDDMLPVAKEVKSKMEKALQHLENDR
ncbi:MAG: DUF302 domain-containing protein [Proteobacteria bacterium]|nr:DUF302 domain-containing protein [Pseudomonadota bacterium]